jgi:hypothetical protein
MKRQTPLSEASGGNMKRIVIMMLIAGTMSLAVGQTGTWRVAETHNKADVEMFTTMENQWAKADNSKDTLTLDRILADDWIYLGSSGTMTKAQHLAEVKRGGGDLEFETLADIKVRVFGEIAVVTGSAYQKSSNKATDTSGHYVWTDVFVKRAGRWQAVNSQDTLITRK